MTNLKNRSKEKRLKAAVVAGILFLVVGVSLWGISLYKINEYEQFLTIGTLTPEEKWRYEGSLDWWENTYNTLFLPLSILLVASGIAILIYGLVKMRALHKIILPIHILLVSIISLSVYCKLFLPYSYFIGVTILGFLLAFSIVKNGVSSKIVFFQVLLIFFLLRNIYFLSTKNVIPFGDGYWDYAVEKTFLEQGQISTIQGVVRPTEAGGISQLTWYSGWPFLHVLGILFSTISGIDLLYLNWILTNVFSLVYIVFTYLIFEKIRIKLRLPKKVTVIALLLIAIIPEAIFWQMQFVRQSLALALLPPIFYFLYILSFERFERRGRYVLILFILIVSLVMAHHVTTLTIALFLVVFSIFNLLVKKFGRWERFRRFFLPIRSNIFSFFGLLTAVLMFLWWYTNAAIIFPTLSQRIILFFESLGIERIYSQIQLTYPLVIRPNWVPALLGFRDLAMYVPAIIGLIILWHNKSNVQEKFLVIYSVLGFGFILFINIAFRIEPLRIILFMAPFLAFLSSLIYSKMQSISRIAIKIVVFIVLALLVSISFIGLWAHNFAPIHLYDSSIDPVEIGEVTPDFVRMKPFFESEVNISTFQDVRADMISRLVYLLDPNDYDKIKSLPVEDFDQLNRRRTLVCSFNDLSLYQYFGYIWSPINVSETKSLQSELKNHLNQNFNRIYNDGGISMWVSFNKTYQIP